MLPSVAASTDVVQLLDKPCFTEIVVTGSSRNRSSPCELANQTLPSRSSKRLQVMSPESPSDFVNTSVLPSCIWISPRCVGSDPETSIAVAEQFIRIDLAVRKQRFRFGCAPESDMIRVCLPASCLSPAPLMPTNIRSVVGVTQVTDPHSGRRIALRRTGLPSPKPRLRTGPESA